MSILPEDFSIVPIWDGVNDFIANMAPLAIMLITIILGFFVLERIVDIFRKRNEK